MAIYSAWFLLMWFQAYIPWAMIFLGSYVIAWQFSLQHETIHCFRGVPKWFRTLIAMPLLGLGRAILLVAYPGFSLGLLRAFIEHRAGPRPGRRVASVESNTLFGLLFLTTTCTSRITCGPPSRGTSCRVSIARIARSC